MAIPSSAANAVVVLGEIGTPPVVLLAVPPLDFDPNTRHLILTGLHRALAAGTPVTDILVVLAEPGIVADMISTLLADMVIGTTNAGTVVAVLVGEAREAMLRALPWLGDTIDKLDDNCVPVVVIDGENTLRMTAVRVARGSHDRRWSS